MKCKRCKSKMIIQGKTQDGRLIFYCRSCGFEKKKKTNLSETKNILELETQKRFLPLFLTLFMISLVIFLLYINLR